MIVHLARCPAADDQWLFMSDLYDPEINQLVILRVIAFLRSVSHAVTECMDGTQQLMNCFYWFGEYTQLVSSRYKDCRGINRSVCIGKWYPEICLKRKYIMIKQNWQHHTLKRKRRHGLHNKIAILSSQCITARFYFHHGDFTGLSFFTESYQVP